MERLKEREQRFSEIAKELTEAIKPMSTLWDMWSNVPMAVWSKAVHQNMDMVFKNRYYDEKYIIPQGKDPDNYINCVQFWGEKIGNEYHRNDWEVWNSGKPKSFLETVEGLNEREMIMKIPIKKKENVGYVMGITLELSNIGNILNVIEEISCRNCELKYPQK